MLSFFLFFFAVIICFACQVLTVFKKSFLSSHTWVGCSFTVFLQILRQGSHKPVLSPEDRQREVLSSQRRKVTFSGCGSWMCYLQICSFTLCMVAQQTLKPDLFLPMQYPEGAHMLCLPSQHKRNYKTAIFCGDT